MNDPNRTSGARTDVSFVCHGSADGHTVAQVRHEFSQWLRAHFALDAEKLSDVVLAVNEALTNAAEFAYLDSAEVGTMALQARHTDDRRLTVVVSDNGTWRQPNPEAHGHTRGRGIPLMRALAEHTTISPRPTGTRVELTFDGCPPIGEEPYATSA